MEVETAYNEGREKNVSCSFWPGRPFVYPGEQAGGAPLSTQRLHCGI